MLLVSNFEYTKYDDIKYIILTQNDEISICMDLNKIESIKTLHQQLCQEISVFPQHHLMLLPLQTENFRVPLQKRHRDAAERKLGTCQVLTYIKPIINGR